MPARLPATSAIVFTWLVCCVALSPTPCVVTRMVNPVFTSEASCVYPTSVLTTVTVDPLIEVSKSSGYSDSLLANLVATVDAESPVVS